jgi:hypothetical protein
LDSLDNRRITSGRIFRRHTRHLKKKQGKKPWTASTTGAIAAASSTVTPAIQKIRRWNAGMLHTDTLL